MVGMRSVRISIVGRTPHIQHNIRLANPMDEYAKRLKELSSKRKKTQEDYIAISDVEWEGSLYLDRDYMVIIPSDVIEGAMCSAAKKLRLGEAVKAGIFCDLDAPLEHDGPKELEKLKTSGRYRFVKAVRVQQARVMRTRPIFPKWKTTFVLDFDPEILNLDQVRQIVTLLGEKVGLSTYRPRFGRFTVTKFEELATADSEDSGSDEEQELELAGVGANGNGDAKHSKLKVRKIR